MSIHFAHCKNKTVKTVKKIKIEKINKTEKKVKTHEKIRLLYFDLLLYFVNYFDYYPIFIFPHNLLFKLSNPIGQI